METTKTKQAKVVAFFCPKGGIGKSTITSHMATILNYLYKDKNLKVGILDIDFLQRNIWKKRQKELVQLKNDQKFKTVIEKFGITPYSIETPQEEDHIIELIEEMAIENDILFVDFPGTLSNKKVLAALLEINYLLIPAFPEEFEEETTLDFIKDIVPKLKNSSKNKFKKAAVVFNKYTGTHDNMEVSPFDLFAKELDELDFPHFESKIYKRDSFQEHKSTILPIKPNANDKASFYWVVQEFLSFIQN